MIAPDSPQVRLAGLTVAQTTPTQLTDVLSAAQPVKGRPQLVGYLNAHVFNACWQFPEVYHLLHAADLVYADGASVTWAARLTGQPAVQRATSADWLEQVLAAVASRGRRLFLVGGAPGMVEQYRTVVAERYPSLAHGICGTMHGFFARSDEESLLQAMVDSKADVLVVGMGTPWQEQFIWRNLARLPVKAVWWIGAGMEYTVGLQHRGPAWTRALGHEWLGRLLSDPRRLAGRYLLGNPLFLWRVMTRAHPHPRAEP